MISVDRQSFPSLEKKLIAFLKERLHGLSLETISTLDDRVGLNYQYRRQSSFDWTAFTDGLNQLSGTAKVEIYVS